MRIGRGVPSPGHPEREARGMPGGRNSEANPHPASYFYVVSAGGCEVSTYFSKFEKVTIFRPAGAIPGANFSCSTWKCSLGAGCMKMQNLTQRDGFQETKKSCVPLRRDRTPARGKQQLGATPQGSTTLLNFNFQSWICIFTLYLHIVLFAALVPVFLVFQVVGLIKAISRNVPI